MKLRITAGDIDLPMVRLESSQKSARGVHLNDLAAYLGTQHLKAKTEHAKPMGQGLRPDPRPQPDSVPINMLSALSESLQILTFDVIVDFLT